MSRIKRFEGSVDGAEEDETQVVGFVFGTTPDTPQWGFVTIPVTAFNRTDQEVLRASRSVKIEGRMCPRGLRCRIVEVIR